MTCDHQLKNIITLVPTKSFFFFDTVDKNWLLSIYIFIYTRRTKIRPSEIPNRTPGGRGLRQILSNLVEVDVASERPSA